LIEECTESLKEKGITKDLDFDDFQESIMLKTKNFKGLDELISATMKYGSLSLNLS